jgi:hypothetical protein
MKCVVGFKKKNTYVMSHCYSGSEIINHGTVYITAKIVTHLHRCHYAFLEMLYGGPSCNNVIKKDFEP